MKPAPFDYLPVASVEAAVAALGEHGDDGKVLAGGQSLVPLLNMRLAVPSVLIDVARVPELRQHAELQSGGVRYGATTVHARFEDRSVPDPTGGLLHHVAGGIGYRAVRNRGTLGGSLAHADASAEWPVVMAAVGATVIVRSRRGERRISAHQLIEGYFTSALAADELLEAVEVPPLGRGVRWGFYKAARKPGEFAESLAIALVGPAGTEIWIGAAREIPVRVAIRGIVGPEGAASDRRGAVASAVAESLGSSGADPEQRYRRHLHGVAAFRALEAALMTTGREQGP